MAPRRIASLTSLLVFIALVFTSVFTYLAPRGPGSSDWTALGVSKHKWMALHTDLGIIFLIVAIVHILYNIKPIAVYLRDQFGKNKVFNINFNIALIITLWAIISSLFSLPPFNWVQSYKHDRGNRGRHHIEEMAFMETREISTKDRLPSKPPLFYSGRSLKRLSGKYEMDLPTILSGLENVGIEARDDWTFNEIAAHNGTDSAVVYEAVLQVK